MALIFNDGVMVNAPLPIERKYLNNSAQPYTGITEVNSIIPEPKRHKGLTVLLTDGEYWYKDGVTDSDLVKKETDITTNAITGATNGLYKDGQDVKLGGGLTENTTISGLSTNELIFKGGSICYDTNYHSDYTGTSLPDVDYVTGITSNKVECSVYTAYTETTDTCLSNLQNNKVECSVYTAYTETTDTCLSNLQNNKVECSDYTAFTETTNTCLTNLQNNKVECSVYTAYTETTDTCLSNLQNNKVECSEYNSFTSTTNTCLTNLENNKQDNISGNTNEVIVHNGTDPAGQSGFIYDISNNSLLTDAENNDYDSNRTTILSSTNSNATGATNSAIIAGTNIVATGATYDNTLSANELALWDIKGTGDLVVRDSSTKKLCLTSLGTIGGISGATNGLGVSGQDICLGGTLDNNTIIDGSGNSMTYCNMSGFDVATQNGGNIILDGEENGGVYIRSQSGTTASGWDGSVGIAVDFDNGFTIYDNRDVQKGILYDADYSEDYDDRSLVDKAFVTKLVTGLQPKAAVLVATTSGITLSGLQTIDGVALSDGDRVLVKDQSNAVENGVYTASTSTWGRSDDMDGSPEGEIAQGDLVPVFSGDTQADTAWILVTDDPITADTTPLDFQLFSRLLDIQPGDGINIETVGGKKTISVDLNDPGSGLYVDSNGLKVASSIAGDGLSWDTGVIDINATSGGTSSSDVKVKLDENDDLVVSPSDINDCLGTVIVKADNGLCKQGDTVVLGGTLTGTTTIDGDSTHNLSISNLNSFGLSFDDQSLITDNRSTGNKKGLEYADNYSDDFDDNSLITKFYVDCKITGATDGAVYNADNGLSKSGDTVVLGGTLTGNTDIEFSTYTLCFGGKFINGSNGSVVGDYSHAEGCGTIASGDSSHAEGCGTIASGDYSHAEGWGSWAIGRESHAEGFETKACSYSSHAEGYGSTTCAWASHAEGCETLACCYFSHAEGERTITSGLSSHAEGSFTYSMGLSSHAEGYCSCSIGDCSHSEGSQTIANGNSSHTEGLCTCANSSYSHAEGSCTEATGIGSHAEGLLTHTKCDNSHAEGFYARTCASGSHAEGRSAMTYAQASHAEGGTTKTYGEESHAEGCNTVTSGASSHAEGFGSKAIGDQSHAEGYHSEAWGNYSHSEGWYSCAIGCYSHAEGANTKANCPFSHTQGIGTVANTSCSHVIGKNNVGCLNTMFEVGIGADPANRCNAFEIKLDGSVLTPEISSGTSDYLVYIDNSTGELLEGDKFKGADDILACNGITKVGDTLVLGGANALTGDTIILSDSNGLAFGTSCETVVSSGNSTFAFGSVYGSCRITAAGKGTFAGGYSHGDIKADGTGTFVFGYTVPGDIIASGEGTLAFGKTCAGTIIAGNYSPNGYGYDYYGTGAFAFGVTSGNLSCVISAGLGSFAGGYAYDGNVKALGDGSFAFGKNTCALSILTTAFGSCTVSSGDTGKFVIGKYNEVKSDTIFEVGIGTSTGDTKNGFEITTSGIVVIPQTPPTGTTSDDVLVWNSSDKKVKKIGADSLGEDNNLYNVTSVTTTGYTATTDDYVLIVDTSADEVTISLPTNPPEGMALKIKDNGNAYDNNITIDAGSGTIDGTQTASINTDYGAIEIVYDGSEWYSLAFVN